MISALDFTRTYNSTVDNANSTSQTGSATAKTDAASTANSLDNKEVFLQLLIAQIKNQDPTNPTDSIQYITQLNQFTGTEQLVDIKQTLKTLSATLTANSTPPVNNDKPQT